MASSSEDDLENHNDEDEGMTLCQIAATSFLRQRLLLRGIIVTTRSAQEIKLIANVDVIIVDIPKCDIVNEPQQKKKTFSGDPYIYPYREYLPVLLQTGLPVVLHFGAPRASVDTNKFVDAEKMTYVQSLDDLTASIEDYDPDSPKALVLFDLPRPQHLQNTAPDPFLDDRAVPSSIAVVERLQQTCEGLHVLYAGHDESCTSMASVGMAYGVSGMEKVNNRAALYIQDDDLRKVATAIEECREFIQCPCKHLSYFACLIKLPCFWAHTVVCYPCIKRARSQELLQKSIYEKKEVEKWKKHSLEMQELFKMR